MKISKGWKEAIQAAAAAAIIGFVIWLLCGCTGTTVGAKYTHHSSVPDYYDTNTTDAIGPYARWYLCRDNRVNCPELEIGMLWEVGGPPVYGRNPVGDVQIRMPVWKKQ